MTVGLTIRPPNSLNTRRQTIKSNAGLKPQLDDEGTASSYHESVINHLSANDVCSLQDFESMIVSCALQSGCTQKRSKFHHSRYARELSIERRYCTDRDRRKQLSLLLMREASRHLKSWQSSQLKTLMSKPCRRQELERIWQVPKQKKQLDIDLVAHANALADLYHDDSQTHDFAPASSEDDIELFHWYELFDELHAMAANKSSDAIGMTAEMVRFALFQAKDIYCLTFSIISLRMVIYQSNGEQLIS